MLHAATIDTNIVAWTSFPWRSKDKSPWNAVGRRCEKCIIDCRMRYGFDGCRDRFTRYCLVGDVVVADALR